MPKALAIALVITLVSGLPLVFISGGEPLTLQVPLLLVAIFSLSAGSALLGKTRWGLGGTKGQRATVAGKRETGTVKWFNASKGFGFITRDNGDDIFVHFRSVRGKGRRVLHDGQRVEFLVGEGDKGLQAEDVAAA